MRKYIKIIMEIIIIFIFVVGCTKKEVETDKLSDLKNKLNKVAEKVFLNDEWTKGGIREDTYTLTLKELAEHNKLKLEDYKNPETDQLCDSEKSNIQFIVGKEIVSGKTNYELKVNLVCE